MDTIERMKEGLNPSLSIAGILVCRVDERTNDGPEQVSRLKGAYKNVFKTVIHESIRLREAPAYGPIQEYAKNSRAAVEYRAVADEIIRQEKKR